MTRKTRCLPTHYSTSIHNILTQEGSHEETQTSQYSLHVRSSNIQSCPNPLHCCANTPSNNRLRECLRKAFSERFSKSIICLLGLGQSSCTSGVRIQGPLTNKQCCLFIRYIIYCINSIQNHTFDPCTRTRDLTYYTSTLRVTH